MKTPGGIIIISLFFYVEGGFSPLNVWDGVVKDQYFHTTAPLDTYTALVSNAWANPLFNDNDVLFRWNGNSSSFMRSTFLVNQDEFAAERIILIFKGVDTFATIKLNNHELGKTSNMHLRYIYDVKDYITFPNQNSIGIEFTSSVKEAEKLYNNHSKSYPVYPKCVPSSYNGECHVNHIRKMQASFGWDWGPAFPISGLWYIPELIAINDSLLLDITNDVELTEENNWRVTVMAHLENAPSGPSRPIIGSLQANLLIKEGNLRDSDIFVSNTTEFSIENGEKTTILSIILTVPQEMVHRWWPNDYGDQTLYALNVSLITSTHTDSKVKKIGFRTVELVQEPLKNGLSFYFKINDVPIFAKGSNLIPVKLFPSDSVPTSNAYLRELYVRTAREARMNMLRVWGGGIYESEALYEAADTYGIMIWQDFMFACSMYPTTPEFLDSVREEVRQQVWRLKSHSSVVIWAGNNENEAALYGNWYGTGKEQVYKDDYIKLYVDVIKKECENADRTRPFVVSSPSNGKYTEENGWVETNPYSNFYGDIHYYNYLADGWDSATYKTPRFASEYGFQSLPSILTLKPYCRNPQVDLVRDSEFLKHRQHLSGGDAFIKLLIEKNLRIPNTTSPMRDLTNYIFLSQLNQAISVKIQTEHYRRAKSTINDAGEGMTMGALYWQLNDVWQAPSWSSIDSDHRWKLLHYFAEEFFAPIIVTHKVEFDELTISIVSDVLTDITNCSVLLRVHKIYNDPSTYQHPYEKLLDIARVPANSALHLPSMSMEGLLKEASCGSILERAKKKCIIELMLIDARQKQLSPSNYVYPSVLKNIDLPACSLGFQYDPTPSFHVPKRLESYYRGIEVTVTSSCTQLFVSFEGTDFITQGRFTENGFHVLEERKKILWLYSKSEPFIDYTYLNSLTATSLGSIYASE